MAVNRKISVILKLWLPVLAVMGMIFYFSTLPASDIPGLFPYQDIVFHAAIYALLAYFFIRALKNTYPGISLLSSVIATLAFGVIYGISDEFHQLFTPGRSCSGFDLFIDGAGTFIGSLIYR